MPLLQSEVGEARPAHALLGISGGDLDIFNRRAPLGVLREAFLGKTSTFSIVARLWIFARGTSGEDLYFFHRRAL